MKTKGNAQCMLLRLWFAWSVRKPLAGSIIHSIVASHLQWLWIKQDGHQSQDFSAWNQQKLLFIVFPQRAVTVGITGISVTILPPGGHRLLFVLFFFFFFLNHPLDKLSQRSFLIWFWQSPAGSDLPLNITPAYKHHNYAFYWFI